MKGQVHQRQELDSPCPALQAIIYLGGYIMAWRIQERRIGWDEWYDTGEEFDTKGEADTVAADLRLGVEHSQEYRVVTKETNEHSENS